MQEGRVGGRKWGPHNQAGVAKVREKQLLFLPHWDLCLLQWPRGLGTPVLGKAYLRDRAWSGDAEDIPRPGLHRAPLLLSP